MTIINNTFFLNNEISRSTEDDYKRTLMASNVLNSLTLNIKLTEFLVNSASGSKYNSTQ